jgi:uncharacterized protein YjbI with pentapeptide repeats
MTARVSQDELDEAIRLHGLWLTDPNCGQRCMFGGQDLSGLQFGGVGGPPIDLNGADFAQADLSGTEADSILVHHCSFNAAQFDGCRWRRPVFAFADMRRVSAKRVEWGVAGHHGSSERSAADFSHAVLRDADLTEARICGQFYGTKLAGASLINADLSLSDFMGPMHYEMNFSRATLSGAKLRDCYISSASLSNANCSGADFTRTVFSEVITKNCNFTGAMFHEAIFERAVFSPHKILDPELQRIITGSRRSGCTR